MIHMKVIKFLLFFILLNILFVFIFNILYSILASIIHDFNYKIGAVSGITLTCLDSVPLICIIEDVLFLFSLRWAYLNVIKRYNKKTIIIILRFNYYYFILLFLYLMYFLIISYLEFYGITGRLPLSLYDL
jgi:hypothetical protein